MVKRKGIGKIIIALGVTAVLVGGTLAWFASSDTVINKFSTGSVPGDLNSGVDIWEKFNEESAKNIVPGTIVEKLVQAKNTASYNSFIRVKIEKEFLGTNNANLSTDMIKLDFGDNLTTEPSNGKWVDEKDGYYYYIDKIAPGKFTNALLKNVELSTEAGNAYKNATFNVKIIAESIQSSNNAHETGWSTSSEAVKAKLTELGAESVVAGGNDASEPGAIEK
ncbi:SipW-dependent-type signal peptide-containing protein [Clostridium septicum]|uniref:SipW-dependent-type signal peptide-containing protein n=1 Tax=Clostridium septicum TaxID=1504 RepID=UPI0008307F5D|nr:SipW-dependent-type signal peptide-containing protein [Clostridium septicum]